MKKSVIGYYTLGIPFVTLNFTAFAQNESESKVEKLCSECSNGKKIACEQLDKIVLIHQNTVIRYKAFNCMEVLDESEKKDANKWNPSEVGFYFFEHLLSG